MMKNLSNRRGISIISLIIIAIIITVVCCVIYSVYSNVPINRINIGLNTINNDVKKVADKVMTMDALKNIKSNKVDMNSDVSMNLDLNSKILAGNEKVQEVINKSLIRTNMSLNYETKSGSIKSQYIYDGQTGFNSTINMFNDNTYLDLGNAFSKLIILNEIGLQDAIFNSASGNIDYEHIMDVISKSFKKYDIKKYITTSKEKITISNESVDATKTTLSLRQMIDEGLLNTIVEDLSNDTEAMDTLIKILNNPAYKTSDEVKKLLQDIANTLFKANEEINFSVYTKGIFNNVVMVELSDDQKDALQYIRYKNKEYDAKIVFKVAEIEIFNITSLKSEKDNYQIKMALSDINNKFSTFFNINGVINNKNIDVDYDLEMNYRELFYSQKYNFTGEFKFKNEQPKRNGPIEQTAEISLNLAEYGKVSLKANTTFSKSTADDIPPILLSPTIDASQLDENDYETILYNIGREYPVLKEITTYLSNNVI